MKEWVGKMLGKVRIDSPIARGGMAEVYLGTHTTLQREVAVKILRNQYEDDEDLLERFQREARVVAKLRHQNIVQVFDYDAVDDRPYIVMEYVSGPSLSKYLSVLHKANAKLSLPEINRILIGVANALQYAHDGGVIHRDIKPGNVILTSRSTPVEPGKPLPQDFEPVLTDFGLVRFLNSSRQTSAGQTAGTPAYMSPEQARGETTDGRTDIYSLGIVLYEMLTGKVPFDGETTMSILLKHISEPPPPVPGLSIPMQKILDKALAKNKEDRFQKPAELAKAFNSAVSAEVEPSTFLGIVPIAEPASVTVAEAVDSLIVVETPKNPRGKWQTVALATTVLAMLGVIYFVTSGATLSSTSTATATITQPIPTTARPTNPSQSILGSTAVLHFKDGDSLMDQVVLEALAMPAPPAGTQYEAWLTGPEGRLSLGILQVDAFGKGTLTYYASQNENLFALYNQIDINITPLDASSSEVKEHVAYSYTMPADSLVYLRQLLVSSPDIPDQTAMIQAFAKDVDLLEQVANELVQAYTSGNISSVKSQAEVILNIIAGDQSQDHRDWDGNGQASNLGTGFGFLLAGDKPGHTQGVFAQAEYIANSPGANQYMIRAAGRVKVCAENLALWISQLKGRALEVVTASSLAEMEVPVKEVEELAKKIRLGSDINENLVSETIDGECGLATIYIAAYEMADMPLLPVSIYTGTGTPQPIGTYPILAGTPTRGSGGGSGQSAATQVPPGQQKTKVPKPTNSGGGGGGGGGGGNGGGGNGGGNNNKP